MQKWTCLGREAEEGPNCLNEGSLTEQFRPKCLTCGWTQPNMRLIEWAFNTLLNEQ
uniref:Uncharacterized protein n=2 Tax=Picea TaxID=3328 RepID=A0A117NGP4_PICGL|nr:hypothetical protein ABT39_MTgene6141 [Picea glauca]QHR92795.1 hypothetical protein Q903MT_gene6843 [Picea sitchensis]